MDHLVSVLARLGVDTIYGIPGGAISPMYDALIACPDIHVVHVRHETSAMFMAVGHARMRPMSLPCVLVTSGPGVTNAVTGLAAARGEGAPVVLIAGEVPRSRFGRNALQEGSPESIDVVQIVRTVTRSAAAITLPGRATYQLSAAAERARAERGPVFLSLPLDVAVAQTTGGKLAPRVARPDVVDGLALEEAAAALKTAERPLLLVGSGARSAALPLRSFATRLRIPVITSPRAKGIVAEGADGNLGVFGYGGHPSAREWLERNPPDVVLALGCGLGEPSTNSWSPLLQASRTMIQVDIDVSAFGRNYRTDVALNADCLSVVELLDDALVHQRPWNLEIPPMSWLDPDAMFDDAAPLRPARVLSVLQSELPHDTVYTADIGEHLLFAIHYLRATMPDQFIASLTLGSMGSGIGAAVGAKMAAPHRRVVSVCGDYGFQMYGMELATCVQERLDVIFVVMNDARMRMVEAGVQRIYGRSSAMDGPLVDFAALARAHGAQGFVVRTVDELRRALRDASTIGPTVLDVRIDRASTFPANARVTEISNFTST